jgi:hypothetical protein
MGSRDWLTETHGAGTPFAGTSSSSADRPTRAPAALGTALRGAAFRRKTRTMAQGNAQKDAAFEP